MKSFRSIVEQEVNRRGWSAYRLGKEADIPIRTAQAFMAGISDLRMAHLESVCKALGLELRRVKKGGK